MGDGRTRDRPALLSTKLSTAISTAQCTGGPSGRGGLTTLIDKRQVQYLLTGIINRRAEASGGTADYPLARVNVLRNSGT